MLLQFSSLKHQPTWSGAVVATDQRKHRNKNVGLSHDTLTSKLECPGHEKYVPDYIQFYLKCWSQSEDIFVVLRTKNHLSVVLHLLSQASLWSSSNNRSANRSDSRSANQKRGSEPLFWLADCLIQSEWSNKNSAESTQRNQILQGWMMGPSGRGLGQGWGRWLLCCDIAKFQKSWWLVLRLSVWIQAVCISLWTEALILSQY